MHMGDEHQTKEYLLKELLSARQQIEELTLAKQALEEKQTLNNSEDTPVENEKFISQEGLRYSAGRKKAEDALQESEAKNRALIKALPDLLFRVNKEGVFLEYHNSANLALAVPPQEFLGKNLFEILPPDLAATTATKLQLALEHKIVQIFEYQFTTDQGTDDFEARISSINDSEAVVMIRNITERKQAVEALKASVATLRSFYDGASMMMGVIEIVGDDVLHISVNQATANFFGTTQEAMCNKLASELGASKTLSQTWIQAYQESAQTGKPVRFEYILAYKKEKRTLSSTVSYIEKTSGGHNRFSYVVEDITERKRIEEAVKESEKRYRHLVNNAGDIIYKVDANGRIILFNPTATRILGYTQEELLGRHYLEVVHPDYHLEGERFYGRQFVKRIPETYYEFPALAQDGTIVWLGQKVRLVTNKDTVVGFDVIARDITERKREEQALKASEKRFSKVFHGSPLSMNIRRLDDGRFVDVNESYLRAIGLSREEVLGRTPPELGVWENPAEYEMFMEMVRREKTVRNFESRLLTRAGVAICLLTAEIIEVDGQQCVLIITTNITERKQTEEEREQLIAQLQEALAQVKTLSGFLPICASCKKIRDDKGYWNQIEEYIHDHSDAEFSHSICPDCSEKLYGEFLKKREPH